MAKKSFKNNPALQFITVQEEPEEQAPVTMAAETGEAEPPVKKEPPKNKAPAAAAKAMAEEKNLAGESAAKRQSGTQKGGDAGGIAANPENLPAEAGLDEKANPAPTERDGASEAKNGRHPASGTVERQPPPMKLNPMYIETRSKRVQLLMQPTLHDRLRQLAAARGQSLNDLVHEALERFAEQGQA